MPRGSVPATRGALPPWRHSRCPWRHSRRSRRSHPRSRPADSTLEPPGKLVPTKRNYRANTANRPAAPMSLAGSASAECGWCGASGNPPGVEVRRTDEVPPVERGSVPDPSPKSGRRRARSRHRAVARRAPSPIPGPFTMVPLHWNHLLIGLQGENSLAGDGPTWVSSCGKTAAAGERPGPVKGDGAPEHGLRNPAIRI